MFPSLTFYIYYTIKIFFSKIIEIVLILERFCNIFPAIKQTSHKASGAEEKELPHKIFSWGILRGPCRWAAESCCPAATPPWAAGRRGMVLGFWQMERTRPVFFGSFPDR